jgi:hypothetical protein
MATASKKSTPSTLINPGKAGVVYTDAGDSLGGGERVEVAEVDDVGRTALDTGQLLLAPPKADGASRTD